MFWSGQIPHPTYKLEATAFRMLIVFIAFQIIAMVDDEDVVSRKNFDHYLISEFMPYVKSFCDVSIKAITTLE